MVSVDQNEGGDWMARSPSCEYCSGQWRPGGGGARGLRRSRTVVSFQLSRFLPVYGVGPTSQAGTAPAKAEGCPWSWTPSASSTALL